MKELLFQTRGGVSTEYPENTMRAIVGAYVQGYQRISVSPRITADGKIVLLRDSTINRTARTEDSSGISENTPPSALTYEDLLRYDFGLWFSPKFRGEPIPLLDDVLVFCEKHSIAVQIDNPFSRLTEEERTILFDALRRTSCRVGVAVCSLAEAQQAVDLLPRGELHYRGDLAPCVLEALSAIVPFDRLTMWITPDCAAHGPEQCSVAEIKGYGRLGVCELSSSSAFQTVLRHLAPDVIETAGQVKPFLRQGMKCDTHIHSAHSHDGKATVAQIAAAARAVGCHAATVTDHCDIEFADTLDLLKLSMDSVADAKRTGNGEHPPEILSGIEIGEGIWNPGVTQNILRRIPCDEIIGSVHAVRFPDHSYPFSRLDFGALGSEMTEKFIDCYFDDLYEMVTASDMDIMAHLTNPIRYTNGKYGYRISTEPYLPKIRRILRYLIDHGIALEVNASCLGSPYNEMIPDRTVLKLYRDMGGYLITYCSDAHSADRVGHEIDYVYGALKDMGFAYVFYLKNRCFCQCTL